jgi:hypothetical protein
MQKISLFLLVCTPILMFAQPGNFQYLQYDTIKTLHVSDTTLAVLYGEIFSTSSTRDSLTVTPIAINQPDEWDAYYCPGKVCLPLDFVPSYSFGLAAGDTADFSFDIQSYGFPGEGEWSIFVVDSATMEIDSAYVKVEFLTTGIFAEEALPSQFGISSVFPNPTNAQVNFNLELEMAGRYTLSLHTLTGRTVLTREYELAPGKNFFSWNLNQLNSGTYLLSAQLHDQIHTQKMVIVK